MKLENREANAADEVEVTPEMIEAGVLALTEHDCRFEPDEMAVLRVFQSMLFSSREAGARVALAPEVGQLLSPYLE